MSDELEAPRPPKSPWQRFYGAVLARRRRAWAARAPRLPRPTLSVGNLHWGGGGKTPLVAALCELLRDSGRRVGILSRGYGRSDRAVRVVSLGEGPTAEPSLAGDEPYLLAERLRGVAVAVSGDRIAAAQALLSRIAIDCFVLDDAFSHVRLARDLDLLAFPASDPFGGGRLLPSGRLREPLSAARFAHAAVLTGLARPDFDRSAPGAAAGLASALSAHGFAGETFACALDARLLRAADPPTPGRFLLVSGTARPESVRRTAEALGLEVCDHLVFPDHHPYPERSLELVRRRVGQTGAALLTTTKDRVKLADRLGLPLWELAVDACPEPRFGPWVETRMSMIESRSTG